MSKINKKKMTIAVLSAALIATVAIGGSLAYLTDTYSKTNEINIETDLGTEVSEPDWKDPDSILPGDTNYKNPYIVTKNKIYARIKIEYKDKENNAITDAERLALIKRTIKYDPDFTNFVEGNSYTAAAVDAFTAMTNTADFTEVAGTAGTDYYYYTGAADKVLTTDSAPLFTTIVVPSDWGNDEIAALGRFDIKVTVEAIQADNNPLPDTVTDIDSYADWFTNSYNALNT